MNGPLFLLERWAQARPAQRFPLLLLALLLLVGLAGGITGCGGGSGGAALLATGHSSTQAGSADAGSALLVLPLQGPVVQLDAPATVRVRIKLQLLQHAHYPAALQAGLALQQPWPTGISAAAASLQPPQPTRIDIDYSAKLHLGAGHTPLVAQVTVRATDPATALLTAALAHATAEADWVVDR